jgi:hypothetical protein
VSRCPNEVLEGAGGLPGQSLPLHLREGLAKGLVKEVERWKSNSRASDAGSRCPIAG